MLKKAAPAEDVFHYVFKTQDGVLCAVVYADGMVNKQLIGDLIVRPLSKLSLTQKVQEKEKDEGSFDDFSQQKPAVNPEEKAKNQQNEPPMYENILSLSLFLCRVGRK